MSISTGTVRATSQRGNLRPDSPAIDAAVPLGGLAFDLDGNGRPCHDAPDIGCYEFCDPRQEPVAFRRADVDQDARITLDDAIALLDWLFRSGPTPPCRSSADTDADRRIKINDAVYLLEHLFRQGAPPPAPYPDCGTDVGLPLEACVEYAAC